jgi:hypothetical protein
MFLAASGEPTSCSLFTFSFFFLLFFYSFFSYSFVRFGAPLGSQLKLLLPPPPSALAWNLETPLLVSLLETEAGLAIANRLAASVSVHVYTARRLTSA